MAAEGEMKAPEVWCLIFIHGLLYGGLIHFGPVLTKFSFLAGSVNSALNSPMESALTPLGKHLLNVLIGKEPPSSFLQTAFRWNIASRRFGVLSVITS